MEEIRIIYHTDEFDEFYKSLDITVQAKFDRIIAMICTVYPINTKFVKKLVNSELYEMRVSVGYNEYRTILFSVNHSNIIEATKIVLLNGFLKKSNKDYEK
ncbi:hypothetical protein EZS27_020162 [termite gut metagenome]|uniref:Uncharacterized protein n=1 Tax=termite gut metagenome TaxID=433724 RepID=A0A5J4RCM4_9ZZZZ